MVVFILDLESIWLVLPPGRQGPCSEFSEGVQTPLLGLIIL